MPPSGSLCVWGHATAIPSPAGYAVNADGQFVTASWLKVIFFVSLSAAKSGARSLSHHRFRGRRV
jgi:hypothetical protein